jgi:hypothetical protein
MSNRDSTFQMVFSFSAALVLFLAIPAAVFGCEQPGTPNDESVTSVSSGSLTYSFRNTARVAPSALPGDPRKMKVFFDINMKEKGAPDSRQWTYIENDGPRLLGYTEKVEYRILMEQTQHINPANRSAPRAGRSLTPGKTYCLRVWARTDDGCRSESSSSWQCGTVGRVSNKP